MAYWKAICNSGTRPEIFRRQLVGFETRPQVASGDKIILYDYSENEIFGPLVAIAEPRQNIVEDALGGMYPFQVRVSWDGLYRLSSSVFPKIETNEHVSPEEFKEIHGLLETDGTQIMLPDRGSPEAAYAGETIEYPGEDYISRARADIEAQLDAEPPESVETDCVDTKQIARSEAFCRVVREAYDSRCAVCGSHRETIDGNPEVEAAHIKPKAEGGPDDIRNGLALCRLHHWAYDGGWLSLTSNLEIEVAEVPDRRGYDEFLSLDGNKIRLPDDARKRPAQKYIAYSGD